MAINDNCPELPDPDPAMFIRLTADECDILRAYITAGWYVQGAATPHEVHAWWETSTVLDDIHTAWKFAFETERRRRDTECRARTLAPQRARLYARMRELGITERAEALVKSSSDLT
jgi:hypothetical protein